MRVLVVDDDPAVRQVVRRSLERAGFGVVEAADRDEALRASAESPVDVAILDLHLPGVSGIELLGELRARDPALHTIMLTGAGSETDRVRGLVSGADDYMVKPFSAAELAARVATVQRRREALQLATTRPHDGAGPGDGGSGDATVVLVGNRIVQANRAAARLLGADDVSELVDRDPLDFAAPGSVSAAVARIERARAGRQPRPEVLTLLRADGEERLVEVASTPVTWEGQPAVQVTLWDLGSDTSKLRELVTGIRTEVPDAVIITDAQLRIQSFNPAAEELYGWREAEVVGLVTLDVLPWLRDDVVASEARHIFQRDGRWHGEVTQRRRDGSTVRVHASATVLRDGLGQAVGVITVNRPIGPQSGPVERPGSADQALEEEIRRGISAGEFSLVYQPVVHLDDRSWSGVEALVRWNHPERGTLAPSAFIDVAERSGAIVDLGHVVLDDACRQWATWAGKGHDIHMAVNLSGRQLAEPELPARLEEVMGAVSMPEGKLWLEVTETALVEDVDQATDVLRRITGLGACISIDDFGTGWASLTYLRQFPVHALKIDRVFVEGLGNGDTDAAIVGSVLSLGRELELSVIAEGIETDDQLAELRKLGCALGQGFLLGRPEPPSELDLRGRA